ncbi:hypothetical protein L596_005395 [Steinernema carpocapsae]|uniref:Nuclear receptor domain-containing protein n=1 Tax=Steinernema carpocapsae TaxID=34508 RepID=A0A4U8UYV9_STECR|nr:hypothetical protein L596_005395 [Steinernema carpocapsae]
MATPEQQICLICGGIANGYHFGAMSCAACNAFFRRSIAEKRKYICRKDGICEINPNARCFCRACRLKKCFVVGMDAKAVQPHRDVIGSKPKKRPPNETSPTLPNVEAKMETPVVVDNLLLSNISNSAFSVPTNKSISVASVAAPNIFAEQLLAFSRTPVIATVPISTTTRDVLNLSTHPVRDIYTSIALEVSKPTIPPITQETASSIAQTSSSFLLAEPKPISPSVICELKPKEVNLIDEMVVAYKLMSERRRMIVCPPTLRDIFGGTQPALKSAVFGSALKKDKLRVQVSLLVEFVNSITPVSMLSVDDKILLFRNLSVPFNILEKQYITMQYGGIQTQRLIQTDFTFVDLSENATYDLEKLKQSDNELPANSFLEIEEIRRIVLPTLRESVEEIAKPMFFLGMTDIEFVALVLIILLNPDIAGLSQIASNAISVARNRLYKDWFAYYEKNGIDDGPLKVGNSLLLLPALQTAVEKVTGNFHMVRVFGLVDYDRILDDVFK